LAIAENSVLFVSNQKLTLRVNKSFKDCGLFRYPLKGLLFLPSRPTPVNLKSIYYDYLKIQLAEHSIRPSQGLLPKQTSHSEKTKNYNRVMVLP
jgi:hypothetical protein